MRRFLASCVMVAVSLGVVQATSTASPVSVNSLTRAKVRAAGISVRYPKAWIVAPLTKRGLQRFAENNPEAASAVESLDPSTVKFFASEDVSGSQIADNESVLVLRSRMSSHLTLSEFKSQTEQAYAQVPGATVTGAEITKVGKKPAYRAVLVVPANLPDGTGTSASVGQLYVPRGNRLVLVTVTTPKGATGTALIDRLLKAVRPL